MPTPTLFLQPIQRVETALNRDATDESTRHSSMSLTSRVGLFLPLPERVWPSGGAMPPVRDGDGARAVDEPVLALLPRLPVDAAVSRRLRWASDVTKGRLR